MHPYRSKISWDHQFWESFLLAISYRNAYEDTRRIPSLDVSWHSSQELSENERLALHIRLCSGSISDTSRVFFIY